MSFRSVLLSFVLPCLLSAQTSVSLSTTPNPSVFGGPVTLTATVTPSSVTGRVTFYDGASILGTATVASGRASLSTVLLPAGVRTIRALYGGDAIYPRGTSNALSQRVNAVRGVGFSALAVNGIPNAASPLLADFK